MNTRPAAIGLAIAPDGTTSEFEFTPGDALAVFQKHVDGYIEPVDLSDQLTLFADEEGLLKYHDRSSMNIAAVAIIAGFYGEARPILGPVIIVGGLTEDGDHNGLTREQVTYLTRLVSEMLGQG